MMPGHILHVERNVCVPFASQIGSNRDARTMATVSFERNLVFSDEEEAQRMLDAIAEADERGPVQYSDFSEQLAIGEEFLKRGLKK